MPICTKLPIVAQAQCFRAFPPDSVGTALEWFVFICTLQRHHSVTRFRQQDHRELRPAVCNFFRLLYHQSSGQRDGLIRQPFHCGVAWRTVVGCGRRRARRNFSFHLADPVSMKDFGPNKIRDQSIRGMCRAKQLRLAAKLILALWTDLFGPSDVHQGGTKSVNAIRSLYDAGQLACFVRHALIAKISRFACMSGGNENKFWESLQ
jgi:hypothetical protein